MWRKFFWALTILLTLMPINWARLRISGEITGPLGELIISSLVSWAVAGALGYFLVVSAKGKKRIAQREADHLQELLSRPLTPIQPAIARLKPGEIAYCSAAAMLKEERTVGYAGGSAGASVRVAKGVTLRTSGSRAKAVRGMVGVAAGELVVTNTRLLYAGDKKSFAVALSDLLHVDFSDDEVTIHTEKDARALAVPDTKRLAVLKVTLDRVLDSMNTATA